MPRKSRSSHLPRYRGDKSIRSRLPRKTKNWLDGGKPSRKSDNGDYLDVFSALRNSTKRSPWKWPNRPIFFLADPHADAEAFVASLVATGGIRKTGKGEKDFKLTKAGRHGRFIIGGDCLDKGPDNLALLQGIRALMDSGARLNLLAGNHDLRLLLGLRVLGTKNDPRTEHFFLRMGPKAVPILKEVFDRYLKKHKNSLDGIPGELKCRRLMYPSKRWFDEFPKIAQWVLSDNAVERELTKIRKKLDLFAERCAEVGLTMRMVYAAALKSREIFLEPHGEFHWFFDRMQLARREGSFLFIHAGVDDRISALLEEKGLGYLNRLYKHQVQNDPFEFYYGPVANTIRTKYRKVDMPLSRYGVDKMHRLGIHAIVHGHRNLTSGQRLMSRHGMLHIESDITMDRNSRRKEGLEDYGIGTTIIRPEGGVLGISSDFPYAKRFRPEDFLKRKRKRSK